MAITPSHRATGADIPEEKKILVQTSSDAGDLFGRGVRSLLRHELWYSRMSTATAFGVVGSPELIASILIETATARSACSSSFLRAGIGCSGIMTWTVPGIGQGACKMQIVSGAQARVFVCCKVEPGRGTAGIGHRENTKAARQTWRAPESGCRHKWASCHVTASMHL